MLRAEATISNDNQIPLSITWTGTDQVSPETKPRDIRLVRDATGRELKLTGAQLVVGCICFLGAAKLLFWALLKLWLFEP